MSPEVAKIRHATPVTEALVRSLLAQKCIGCQGLNHEQNVRAYAWRRFELRFPRLTRLAAFFVLSPRIAVAPKVFGALV